MKCVICKDGLTQPGTTTVTLERDDLVLVIKDVPAQVCANCGEAYLEDDVTAQVLRIGEEAANAGVQVDVRTFVAA